MKQFFKYISFLIILLNFNLNSLAEEKFKVKIKDKFNKKEMVDKANIYFADLSEGVSIIIERSFSDFGQQVRILKVKNIAVHFLVV